MQTTKKGEIAVLKVTLRALEKGFIVSKPIVDTKYDLIVDDGKERHRVQVKYANGKSSHSSGAVVVQTGTRKYKKTDHDYRTGYTSEDIDAILVYLPSVDKILWIGGDKFEGKRAITMRHEKSKNGQEKGINLVEDFVW